MRSLWWAAMLIFNGVFALVLVNFYKCQHSAGNSRPCSTFSYHVSSAFRHSIDITYRLFCHFSVIVLFQAMAICRRGKYRAQMCQVQDLRMRLWVLVRTVFSNTVVDSYTSVLAVFISHVLKY